jgi:hypothetical protein
MQITAKFTRVVEQNAKGVMAPANFDEVSAPDDLLNRGHGEINQRLKRGIDERRDRLTATRRPDCDEWSLRLVRLDEDQRGIGFEVLPRALEGMDHALDGDSSKRPAEERHIELLVQAERISGINAKVDVLDTFCLSHPARLGDLRSIWLDRRHACGSARDLTGQPTIATSDFEDPNATDVDIPFD